MNLPYPDFVDSTTVEISITSGFGTNGLPNVVVIWAGKARFNEQAITVRNPDGTLIQLSGKLYIGCDIAPTITQLEGTVEINSVEYKINKGRRPRNLDGSVHHTELELI